MTITIKNEGYEFVIKDTHRGLYFEDGKLTKVLEAGRYEIPRRNKLFSRAPVVECVLVDVRERELTIKGQEILTSDKVAIRVSILVQFRVTDPQTAVRSVENFEDRLYSDVQLAARRSLAGMTLEEILTNRNRLSEEILSDVKELASGYGVAIRRADVKDLIFPGNLQEIMNRVLAAERNSQAQLVAARTNAEVQQIEARSNTEIARLAAESDAELRRLNEVAEAETRRMREAMDAESRRARMQLDAEAMRVTAVAEVDAFQQRIQIAEALDENPALLRMVELEALGQLAKNANARLYVGTGQVGFGLDGSITKTT